MDRTDVRNEGVSSQGGKTPRRTMLLAALLAVIAVPFAASRLIPSHGDSRQGGQHEQVDPSQYAAFLKAATEAEATAEPLQRCLAYPDPPGSHWNTETTRAYCELRTHKTMLLTEIDELLKQGRAADVDHAFQGYLDEQLKRPGHPGVFDIAFANAGFDKPSPEARRVIDAWKRQAPESAFALAASGVQNVYAAQAARGDDAAIDVSEQQMNNMDQLLMLARRDLDDAVAVVPNMTAAYGPMIHLGGLVGDRKYQQQAAASGLLADPYNFGIRIQMMNQAQPQWGRRFGGLARQQENDEADASHNPLLRMVAQNPQVYRAYCNCSPDETHRRVEHAIDRNLSSGNLVNIAGSVYDSDPRMAVEIYSEALRFEPTEADALRWRSQLMIKLGDRQGAIDAVAAASSRFPENATLATLVANIYRQAGRIDESEKTYLAVIERYPDALHARSELGDLYNHEAHQPEKANALADALIAQHPEYPEGYIVRACYLMDHNLPGRYETIHFFIDHYGNQSRFQKPVSQMKDYLAKHPEPTKA
jgi:tetratricopeptide (TPR) repeat protein